MKSEIDLRLYVTLPIVFLHQESSLSSSNKTTKRCTSSLQVHSHSTRFSQIVCGKEAQTANGCANYAYNFSPEQGPC